MKTFLVLYGLLTFAMFASLAVYHANKVRDLESQLEEQTALVTTIQERESDTLFELHVIQERESDTLFELHVMEDAYGAAVTKLEAAERHITELEQQLNTPRPVTNARGGACFYGADKDKLANMLNALLEVRQRVRNMVERAEEQRKTRE